MTKIISHVTICD